MYIYVYVLLKMMFLKTASNNGSINKRHAWDIRILYMYQNYLPPANMYF